MQHMSHDIVEVEPRHTGTHQKPIQADHERHVHLNPSRSTALITAHSNRGGGPPPDGIELRFIREGGNCLLDPPRLSIASLGGKPVVVTVESLLYAIKQMQDAPEFKW